MRNAFAILLIALVFIQPSQLWSRASAPQARTNTDSFCVKDEASYNQYKELLPNYFQNLPVAMGVQTTVLGTDVIAVLNIGFRSDVLTLRSDVWKLGARYTDDQEIKKVCFDRKKKRMEITFNNKQTMNVRYRNEGFDTDGVTLTRLNAAQRQAYTDRIIQKENEKNGTSAPAPSAPAPNEVQR
jgi:hypothetical protein